MMIEAANKSFAESRKVIIDVMVFDPCLSGDAAREQGVIKQG